ncbi:hypothetical protein CEW87_04005 [Parazoarcus communis]|uniref:DUF2730 domain-containing protein n=1 Tax=Parazoarcus communis TaxID=41977 RepID=A0A2U8GY14_9RHOO|nr:DUF2730 family protein [Parazoarcus communis]AWI78597.1 hypothetical protein CEW87_04005 [Parazoarcus communis]|tara:strand:- start:42557 stop:42928 length:372 start_codon:yes stop_codon:yes gene_type:complete
MDPKELQTWLSIINTVVIWAVAIYTWQANRNRVTNERISSLQGSLNARIESIGTDMDRRLDTHADRLSRVEKDLEHAPTHEDLKRLHARIDDLAGGIRGLEGEFKGANHTLQLIHGYLLQGKQ